MIESYNLDYIVAALHSLGLSPLWHKPYYAGDCLYDSLASFPTSLPSTHIRNMCMDVLPSVVGTVLVVGNAEVVVDLTIHNVTTLQEYVERQRMSFASGSPSLQGDFTCVQCAALAIQRDIVVWVVGVEQEVRFGILGSREPLRLLYTGNGKSDLYIPVLY